MKIYHLNTQITLDRRTAKQRYFGNVICDLSDVWLLSLKKRRSTMRWKWEVRMGLIRKNINLEKNYLRKVHTSTISDNKIGQ